jgi:hypothetical protein
MSYTFLVACRSYGGEQLVLMVSSIRGVILARWRWFSLRAFAMWPIVRGYWDGIRHVTSFSPSDLHRSGMRFIVRLGTMIAIAPVFSSDTGSTHHNIGFEPSR